MTDDPERLHPTHLVLDEVNENPPGSDERRLNEEYVSFKNAGDSPLFLAEWTVGDEAGTEYRFPTGTTLDAGNRLTLRSGAGVDTETTLYWGATTPVWANMGDTVLVRDAEGRVRIRYSYNE